MNNQETRAILCPNCRKLVSADVARCPHCGQPGPGTRLRNNPLTRGIQDPNQLVRMIIWVNVGMYLLSILMNPRQVGISWNPLTALSPDNDSLLLLGATGTVPIDRLHRWWTLLSANYLHGGLLHILFNMMALRQLAPFVVREYGPYRMISLYTLGGVTGYGVSYVAGVPFTIGASAALCALIGSALYYGKSRGGTYGQAVYRQVSGWVISLFVFGLLFPGINNWGHGGGILGGIGMGYLLGYHEKVQEKMVHKYLGIILLVVTVLILAWAVLTGVYYRFVV